MPKIARSAAAADAARENTGAIAMCAPAPARLTGACGVSEQAARPAAMITGAIERREGCIGSPRLGLSIGIPGATVKRGRDMASTIPQGSKAPKDRRLAGPLRGLGLLDQRERV